LPSHQENFGIAVLEAMARGVPPLVSERVNLAPEIGAADAGWVTRDDAHLARVLAEAIANDGERARRATNARALAERYRWPAIGASLADAYARIVAHAPIASAPMPSRAPAAS